LASGMRWERLAENRSLSRLGFELIEEEGSFIAYAEGNKTVGEVLAHANAAFMQRGCQSASNFDPQSALKSAPLDGDVLGR